MDQLRNQIGFSLQELETALFDFLARQFAEVYAMAIEEFDAWLAQQRDSQRWRLKGLEPRSLQTLFGVDVTFRRRRYVDRETGKSVYLLDEVLKLPEQKQISPALAGWALGQAVLSNSYRAAAESLKAMYRHAVVSHESVRQVVLAMGRGLRERQAERLCNPEGTRKVRLLFLEVDGLDVPLQQAGHKRRVEEKLLTSHEGWQQRHPASDEYQLVGKRHFRTQDRDFWEAASRFVYSEYDIGPDTVVVINGDRASWIRKGVKFFPNAIYQVDTFHLMRELRRLFGRESRVVTELEEARQADVTGATFLAKLAEACRTLNDPEKRRQGQSLLRDLTNIPEAVVDYRKRLAAMGVPTEGLRGLGAAESQIDTFADRVKHRGRSWSRPGLAAIMEVLCWRNTDSLHQVMSQVEELLARTGVSLDQIKEHAARRMRAAVSEGLGVLRGTVPITRAGRSGSGGMSRLMHRIISGTTG